MLNQRCISQKSTPGSQTTNWNPNNASTSGVFYSTTYNPAINHCDLQRADNINIGSFSKAMNNSGIFSQTQPSLLTKNAKNLRECSSGLTFPSPQQQPPSQTILVPLRNWLKPWTICSPYLRNKSPNNTQSGHSNQFLYRHTHIEMI